MSAIFFSASDLPISGLPPAPSPSPSSILTGTGDGASDLLSVLHTANVTPEIFSSYIFLTALHPPPPTPITLMIPCILSSTGPKSNISSIFTLLIQIRLQRYRFSAESPSVHKACEKAISLPYYHISRQRNLLDLTSFSCYIIVLCKSLFKLLHEC